MLNLIDEFTLRKPTLSTGSPCGRSGNYECLGLSSGTATRSSPIFFKCSSVARKRVCSASVAMQGRLFRTPFRQRLGLSDRRGGFHSLPITASTCWSGAGKRGRLRNRSAEVEDHVNDARSRAGPDENRDHRHHVAIDISPIRKRAAPSRLACDDCILADTDRSFSKKAVISATACGERSAIPSDGWGSTTRAACSRFIAT